MENNAFVIAFDTETTGVGKDDEILQLSIVDQNEDTVWDEYYMPRFKKRWNEAAKFNHISYGFVKNKPNIIEQKAQIEEIFATADLVIGYNIGFDLRMLQQNGIQIDLDKEKYVDLMLPFAKMYQKEKRGDTIKLQALKTCAEWYGFRDFDWHNAVADAEATMACYKAMVGYKHINILDVYSGRHWIVE